MDRILRGRFINLYFNRFKSDRIRICAVEVARFSSNANLLYLAKNRRFIALSVRSQFVLFHPGRIGSTDILYSVFSLFTSFLVFLSVCQKKKKWRFTPRYCGNFIGINPAARDTARHGPVGWAVCPAAGRSFRRKRSGLITADCLSRQWQSR